jgi:23S rRNA pseudouridine2605 synthase
MNKKPNRKKPNQKKRAKPIQQETEVRLNRYIAQAGVCSRRDADKLIAQGKIKVNDRVVTELGVKVNPQQDQVSYQGRVLKAENFVYILLNKPKNVITTMSDPKGRTTILDAIEDATDQRVFPVGRLDRNTTGLILLTNDGKLTEKLTHPSYEVKKLYHVRLDKPVSEEDLERLRKGIKLEDGLAQASKVSHVMGAGTNEVGIEIHIGRNRIVRRMFEAMGYQVVALDRVMLGHLTKKRLPRGQWRELTEKEVRFLKMM